MATISKAPTLFSTSARISSELIRWATLRAHKELLKIRSISKTSLRKVNNVICTADYDDELTASPARRADRSSTSLKIEPPVEKSNPIAGPEMEPKLMNLWNVYQRAKADYLVVANDQNHAAARAARFLRDTAENILSYFENKTTDPIMMAELDATCRMAKEAAVSLTGGKKRKFDVGETDRGTGVRRGYGSLPYRSRNGGGQRYGSMRRSRSPVGFTSGHYGHGGPPSYPAATQAARGPSGIPFGYSRPVDSYHPY
jgi:hypothetical protein